MQESALSTLGLPIALAIIMLGLGLHLTIDDFKRVIQRPKAVLIGLGCQMLILPVICFFIAKGFGLAPALAVGMMLLATSPGGTSANLYSHLFKGDVALNISLTAINSVLAIVTIPFFVNFAMEQFVGTGQFIPLQFKKVLEVIAIVLIPVLIGMVVNAKLPSFARSMDKPVKIASAGILFILVLVILLRERANVPSYFAQVGLPALIFNLFSLLIGYYAGKIGKLSEGESRAIAFEIGVHNGTLAIYLALVVLANNDMAVPAAIYSLIMFVTAAVFGWWVNKKSTF
jgi:bile acid:Na+ symporter, BASS family